METNCNLMLETLSRTFCEAPAGATRGDAKLDAQNRGVLNVAILVAALDGVVLPAEEESLRHLAASFCGADGQTVRGLIDDMLMDVGRLVALAGTGTETERLSEFVARADMAMPYRFESGKTADIRRAFALWIAMGVSDGEFSPVERRAIELLAEHFADVRLTRAMPKENLLDELSWDGLEARADFDLAHAACYEAMPSGVGDPAPLLEPDFCACVERVAADLNDPERRALAEESLRALIAGK